MRLVRPVRARAVLHRCMCMFVLQCTGSYARQAVLLSCAYIPLAYRQPLRMLRLATILTSNNYGCRGPHENYVDRCDGAPARVYSAAVAALHVPYIAPSENGGREAARWLALMPGTASNEPDSDGDSPDRSAGCPSLIVAHTPPANLPHGAATRPWGVRNAPNAPAEATKPDGGEVFVPADGLHFSASYYSTAELLKARHEHELEGGACRLHVDGAHMGVGGDDSWTPSVRFWRPCSASRCAGNHRSACAAQQLHTCSPGDAHVWSSTERR